MACPLPPLHSQLRSILEREPCIHNDMLRQRLCRLVCQRLIMSGIRLLHSRRIYYRRL